jgi:5'-deoxynucleotidase YfbR-like HD superfamily hydrolase
MTNDEFYGPDSFGSPDYPNEEPYPIFKKPILTEEEEKLIRDLYSANPQLNNIKIPSQVNSESAWIQTYTGKKMFPLAPRPEDVCIEDIAHALAMQCRFTGHCNFHYSVAQHSVYVSLNCPKDALHGLLHDASEAYICDLASPLKRSGRFEDYKVIEKNLQDVIYSKFGLTTKEPATVKAVDIRMLVTEARDLMSPQHPEWINSVEPYDWHIDQMSPSRAKHFFLQRFYELTDKLQGSL